MRCLPAILAALAVSTLAGCAAPAPPPPPMSPYPAGGYGYGYAEERVGPDLLRVVYFGPLRRLDYDGASGAQLERAAAEAADLALWRAAQLALAEGKPAFAIVDRRTDTETLRRPGYVDDPWWPDHCWHFGRRWTCQSLPPIYYPPAANGRARVTLVVRLESRVTARNIDAAATVKRFEAAHGAPAQPANPPAPRP